MFIPMPAGARGSADPPALPGTELGIMVSVERRISWRTQQTLAGRGSVRPSSSSRRKLALRAGKPADPAHEGDMLATLATLSRRQITLKSGVEGRRREQIRIRWIILTPIKAELIVSITGWVRTQEVFQSLRAVSHRRLGSPWRSAASPRIALISRQ